MASHKSGLIGSERGGGLDALSRRERLFNGRAPVGRISMAERDARSRRQWHRSRPEASPRVDTCGLRTNSRHAALFERKLSGYRAPSSQYCVRDGFVVWRTARAHTHTRADARTHARTHSRESPSSRYIASRSSYIRCSLLRRTMQTRIGKAVAKMNGRNNKTLPSRAR